MQPVCIVLGVEIEHELFSGKRFERSDRAEIVRQFKIRGLVAGAKSAAHFRLPFVSLNGKRLREPGQSSAWDFDKPRIFGYGSGFPVQSVAEGPLPVWSITATILAACANQGRPRPARNACTCCAAQPFAPAIYASHLADAPACGFARRSRADRRHRRHAGGVYLAKGPIVLASLGPRITQALNEKVAPDYAFKLGGLSVTTHGLGPDAGDMIT